MLKNLKEEGLCLFKRIHGFYNVFGITFANIYVISHFTALQSAHTINVTFALLFCNGHLVKCFLLLHGMSVKIDCKVYVGQDLRKIKRWMFYTA